MFLTCGILGHADYTNLNPQLECITDLWLNFSEDFFCTQNSDQKKDKLLSLLSLCGLDFFFNLVDTFTETVALLKGHFSFFQGREWGESFSTSHAGPLPCLLFLREPWHPLGGHSGPGSQGGHPGHSQASFSGLWVLLPFWLLEVSLPFLPSQLNIDKDIFYIFI